MYSVALGGGQPSASGLADSERAAAQIGSGASYGVALGSGAAIADKTVSATAIGSRAATSASGGVALGAGSQATRGGSVAGYVQAGAGIVDQAAVKATQSGTGAVTVGDEANHVYRQITGVAAGSQATDAVNVAQLQATNNQVANLGDTVNQIGGKVIQLGDTVSAINGNVTRLGDTINQIDGRVTQNRWDIDELKRVGQDAVLYDSPDHSVVTLGGARSGAVRLTNVQGGRVASDSTDAINGSQLHASNESIANALGGGASVGSDGTVTSPTIHVDNTTYTNVTEAIENVDARTISNTADIASLTTNIKYGTIGLVQQSSPDAVITIGKDSRGKLVDFSSSSGEARQLTGVADGLVSESSVYAVNGSQLYGVSESIASGLGGGSYVKSDGTISAPSYRVGGNTYQSVGGAIENLDGRVTNIEGTVTNISTQISNGEIGLVQQDAATGTITVGAGKAGTTVDVSGAEGARTVTGVADGEIANSSQDAINGGQLYALTQQMGITNDLVSQHQQSIGDTLSQANAYTDQQMNAAVQNANGYTDRRIASVRRDASAGTAAAMAMAGLPQATQQGRGMTALAGSTYDGQSALALGVSRMSGTGRWVFKGSASTNTRGYYGFTVGAGRHW